MNLIGPIFYSSDLGETVSFYKSLGLKLEYQDGNHFAAFRFENGAELGIKTETGGREKPGSQTMMVEPIDINQSYEMAKQNDLIIVRELQKEDWGIYYIISDPDGNCIEYIEKPKK